MKLYLYFQPRSRQINTFLKQLGQIQTYFKPNLKFYEKTHYKFNWLA